MVPPDSETTIHDLGYRRYDGERIGARGALRALYWQGVRALCGVGRPAKAKAVPVFVVVVTMLPALAAVVVSGKSGGVIPIRYANIFTSQLLLFVLFVAAQAPEILSRDQQHRVLPLMLTRELTHGRYALARWGALYSVMFVVCLAPLLLLYFGEIGVATDPATTFAKMGKKIGPVLMQALLTAGVFTGLGSALAAFTARRAYATASIFGVFIVLKAVSVGLGDLSGSQGQAGELLDLLGSLRTMALILFDEKTRAMELTPPASVWVYVATMLVTSVIGALMLRWRIRRVAT